jgi:hypothetical protein
MQAAMDGFMFGLMVRTLGCGDQGYDNAGFQRGAGDESDFRIHIHALGKVIRNPLARVSGSEIVASGLLRLWLVFPGMSLEKPLQPGDGAQGVGEDDGSFPAALLEGGQHQIELALGAAEIGRAVGFLDEAERAAES